MSSPIRRKAEQIAADAALPQDNWLARRIETIRGHETSVSNGIWALRDIGSLILAGRISTDLLIENGPLNVENLRASDYLGHISCSVIPSLQGLRQSIPHGLGYSWTPDVALQVTFAFQDTYDYGTPYVDPQPTGNVQLRVHARTWGRILDEEMSEIAALGTGKNTWAEYGDQGHSRRGTHVSAVRMPGEVLTQHQAETMLAPLAPHIIGYFDLVDMPHLAQWQKPGNFTTHTQ